MRASVAVGIACAVWSIYYPTHTASWVFDDLVALALNRALSLGLTWPGVGWAFTTIRTGNWFPLTWLTHMLDVTLYGWHAWGAYHLTNILLHIANSLLVFWVLRRMTGAFWKSALVAAIFAVHPLRVESVAWITERKDVLSAFFWLATIWAYVHYTARTTVLRYLLVLLLYVMGMLAKPMLVTLPLILFLLDYWPLHRRWSRSMIAEKVPLFFVALLGAMVAMWTQTQGGAVASVDMHGIEYRGLNAIASYLRYLMAMLWPVELSVYYPMRPNTVSFWASIFALPLIGWISWQALQRHRIMPELSAGWGWFVISLLPVIGLVQIGSQSHADRYTYLPSLGASIAAIWLISRLRIPASVLTPAAVAVVGCFGMLAANYVGAWKGNETLFRHALRRDPMNWMAHVYLGRNEMDRGNVTKGEEHYYIALAQHPSLAKVLIGLEAAPGAVPRTTKGAVK